MKNSIILTAALLLILESRTNVQAHAFVDHADPRVGSTVNTSPTEVKIWFTDDLQATLSKMRIVDAKGKEVDLQDCRCGPGDRSLMCVSVQPLPPGVYKVVWKAVATDTHHTSGSFSFTVASPHP